MKLITVGDLRQCLPVIPKGSPAQILASSIIHSPFWKDVQKFSLTINMRLLVHSEQMMSERRLEAECFARWLLTVGDGTHDTVPLTELPQGISIIKWYMD